MAGQAACLVHERRSARDVVEELMAQGMSRASLGLQGLADVSALRVVRKRS